MRYYSNAAPRTTQCLRHGQNKMGMGAPCLVCAVVQREECGLREIRVVRARVVRCALALLESVRLVPYVERRIHYTRPLRPQGCTTDCVLPVGQIGVGRSPWKGTIVERVSVQGFPVGNTNQNNSVQYSQQNMEDRLSKTCHCSVSSICVF